jgi:hypothetical protein
MEPTSSGLLLANLVAAIAVARIASYAAKEYLGWPALSGALLSGLALAFVPKDFLDLDHPLYLIAGLWGVGIYLFSEGLAWSPKPAPGALRIGLAQTLAPLAACGLVIALAGHGARAAWAGGVALAASSLTLARRMGEDEAYPEAWLGLAVAGAGQALAATRSVPALVVTVFLLGAFGSGVMAARLGVAEALKGMVKPAGELLAPLYFLLVAAQARLIPENPFAVEQGTFFCVLLFAAIGARIGALWAWETPKGLRGWVIAACAGAPGEIGIIAAQAGLDSGALDPRRYSVVVLAAILLTVAAPIVAKISAFLDEPA